MRTRGMKQLAMTAGLMSFLCGTSMVLADVPAALDRVPESTQVVIAVRSIESLKTKAKTLFNDIGVPFVIEPDFDMFTNTAGLNKGGSLAVVLTLPEGGGEPEPTMLIPVSDAVAFIKAWGGTGEGVSEVTMLGNTGHGFAKDIGGGYIAVSEDKETVEAFTSKPGSKAAHVKALGATGNRIADSADVVVIANFQNMKEEMEMGVQEMKDSFEGIAQMMPDGGEQLAAMMKMVTNVADAVMKDGQTGIIGFGIDSKGVNVDLAANFAEGSDSAKKFVAKGKAASMSAALPAGDFLFAGSMDYSDPSLRAMYNTVAEASKANPAAAAAGDFSKIIEQSTGYSTYVGVADLSAGLLANTGFIVSSAEPAKLQSTMKGLLAEVNGKTIEGTTFKSDYKENNKEVAGLKASTYSLALDIDPNQPGAAKAMAFFPMIVGPEGKITGYAVSTEKSTIMTLSRNSVLLERMIASAKGDGGFAADPLVAQTAERLPADRVMDVYIGVKGLADMGLGVLAMMGQAPAIEMPEQMAPVGMGVSMSQGGFQFRTHIPTDVLKAVMGISQQMQGGGGDDMGEEPMDSGDEKPRF